MTSLRGGGGRHETRCCSAVIALFLLWDVVWWVLGVKPRFPWQLKARLSAGAPDLVLLDVRTPLEYNWFHFLPGAQNAYRSSHLHDEVAAIEPLQTVFMSS